MPRHAHADPRRKARAHAQRQAERRLQRVGAHSDASTTQSPSHVDTLSWSREMDVAAQVLG